MESEDGGLPQSFLQAGSWAELVSASRSAILPGCTWVSHVGYTSERLGGPVPSGFHAGSSQEVQRMSVLKGAGTLALEPTPPAVLFLSTLNSLKLKRKY